MRRVGYDADTQTYTYQDTDGSVWEGAPGARYGKLTQIGRPNPPRSRTPSPPSPSPPPPPPRAEDNSPRESSNRRVTRRFSVFGRADHNEDPPVVRNEDWRILAPFLLIVCLVLLLIWHMLSG